METKNVPLSVSPQQAIQDWLADPANHWAYPLEYPGVDLTAVQFLKKRSIAGYEFYALRWLDQKGGDWSGFVGVSRSASGAWYVDGGGWGEGLPLKSTDGPPHAFMAGNRGSERISLGSFVDDPTNSVVQVRLVANGMFVAEDMVEEGIVLFVERIAIEGTFFVELYNGEGELLNRHEM